MRTRLVAAQVVLAAVLGGVAVGPATAAEPTVVSECTTISSSGSYELGANVSTGSPGDCITVVADDVVLDGAGHSMTGSTWDDVGINVSARNVTVTGVTMSQWDVAVGVFGPANTVRGNVFTGNEFGGSVVVRGADHNRVLGNTFREEKSAVSVKWARDSLVANNTATDFTGYGVNLFRAGGTTVTGNTLSSGNVGLRIRSSTDVTVRDSNITDTEAIRLDNVGRTTVSDVAVSGSGETRGLLVEDSWNSTVRNATLDGSYVEVARASNVTLRDLSVTGVVDTTNPDGPLAEGGAVRLVDSKRITVTGSDVSGNDARGIYVPSTADFGNGYRVVNSTVSDNAHRGILLMAGPGTVADTTVRNDSEGVVAISASDVTLSDNEVHGGRFGVLVTGGADHVVDGNRVTGADWAGVRVEDAIRSTLGDNVVRDNGVAGVRVHRSPGVTVRNTTATGNAVGVWSSRLDGATVSDVDASGNADAGVRLQSTDDATVGDVAATRNRFGVRGVGSVNVSLADASARGNDAAGVRFEADPDAASDDGRSTGHRLANVTASDNGIAGVRFHATNDSVVENATTANDTYGIWLTRSADVNLSDVTARTNGQWAVLTGPDARNVTGRDVNVGTVPVDLNATAVAVGEVATPPAPPSGYDDVDRHLRTMATGTDASLDLTVGYTDAAVADAGVNESSLRLWRHDGAWTEVVGTNDVNTTTDTVQATVTEFGVLAPLGEETNTTSSTTESSSIGTLEVAP